MRDFDILLARLEAAGFSFKYEPERLHHRRHGQASDTFLVYDNGSRRHPLDSMIYWSITANGQRYEGIEAAISKWNATTIRKFVRGPLYAYRNDFSEYGWGLMIGESPPDQWNMHNMLADLPTYEKTA